jgi:hypothetical protein
VVEVVKEREKFLMAMARLALGNDRTIEHVERREHGDQEYCSTECEKAAAAL